MAEVRIAIKTIDLIDSMIYADQGSKFRQILGTLMPEAKDAYEPGKDDFRSHLGASMIGRECARELWYNFHWTKPPKFEGRMLRLFNRGHLEEPRLVAMLKMIGCEVWSQDAKGDQYKVTGVGGHFGSAIDGVLSRCPDLPDFPILGEFKTYNDKQFTKLAGKSQDFRDHIAWLLSPNSPKVQFTGKGVKVAKFEHYVQMQIYMGYYKLTHALYLAVNKNDDQLYAEIIEFDKAIYDLYWGRAEKIIMADTIPPRISDTPAFFKCQFCDFKRICHMGDPVSKNCRTCAGSVPTHDGQWHCIKWSVPIDKKVQLQGCEEYDQKREFLL